MKGNIIIGLAIGLMGGILIGRSLNKPALVNTAEPDVPEQPATNEVVSTIITNEPLSEKQLLLMAINELDLTTAELEQAKDRLWRMERKATRYDWLRDNGLHGDYSMSFRQETFQPQKKLVDFLGLNEEEELYLKNLGEATLDTARNWELEHAVCTAESSTNCTYEIGILPESIKEEYIANLGSLMHEEDVQLLLPSIDEMFKSYENKRVISATFISAEEYEADMKKRGHSRSNMTYSNRVKISAKSYDENGNHRTSSTSTFSLKKNHLSRNNRYQRWNHLFDLDSLAE